MARSSVTFLASVIVTLAPAASITGAVPAAAAEWTEVGAPSRPAWVPYSTERRLRLLPALPPIKTTLQGQVNGYFGTQGPSLSIGLVLDTGLFYSQSFGFRDLGQTQRADDTTVYRAGSFTKVVTAATLLTLVGKSGAAGLSIDDAAVKFVPELKNTAGPGPFGPTCPERCNIAEGACMAQAHSVADRQGCIRDKQQCATDCPPTPAPVSWSSMITLRHLVSHTSGLPNEMKPAQVDQPTWLGELQATRVMFKPGDYRAYTGVAVELESVVIERKTNKKFDAYMKDALLTPLGMSSTHLHHEFVPANLLAQQYVYSWPDGQPKPSFAPPASWDDPQMLIPAGNLFTSVADLAKFIRMEITGSTPGGMFISGIIRDSQKSAVPASKTPPPANCDQTSDGAGSSYSPCADAAGFGYGWFVDKNGFIEHNGSWGGQWGSQTRIHVDNKMGATGLIATEPYPAAPAGSVTPANMDAIVYGVLDAGLLADKADTWSGKQLSVGVARVLYLSGKNPAQADFDAFTPQFIAANNLTKAKIVAFLTAWKNQIGACSTFRVRDVASATQITVRFTCAKKEWETVLQVGGAPYQVAWGLGQPAGPSCEAKCNVAEGTCMSHAHSVGDRQGCIADKKACAKECK